jgi:hypothetical protein
VCKEINTLNEKIQFFVFKNDQIVEPNNRKLNECYFLNFITSVAGCHCNYWPQVQKTQLCHCRRVIVAMLVTLRHLQEIIGSYSTESSVINPIPLYY